VKAGEQVVVALTERLRADGHRIEPRRKVLLMRVLELVDWSKLVVADGPDPAMGDCDVLLEVLATGICGSDIHGYTGENGRRQPGQVMGHETVGRVVALGGLVGPSDGISIGDIATVNPVIGCKTCAQCLDGAEQACPKKGVIGVTHSLVGAFAEFLSAPACNVVPLPSTMPVEYGAMVEPLAVGYHAVRRGAVSAGDSVLIVGGGPVGQACVLGAQRLGATRIVVSEPSAYRRAISSSIGAVAIDPTSSDFGAAVTAALGSSPDVVIDAVGTNQSLASAFAAAALTSTVVLVGMGHTQLAISAFEVSTKERSLVGSFCYSPDEFRDTAAWVGDAPAVIGSMIGGMVELAQAPATFATLAHDQAPQGKILVVPHLAGSTTSAAV
jgi:threonine dehydrogenase-like Zn-dependent dehydrogenase